MWALNNKEEKQMVQVYPPHSSHNLNLAAIVEIYFKPLI